ncbi:MAG: glycoside hydrolase family 3 protein [Candidatus Sumerlaeaceae bacterium]
MQISSGVDKLLGEMTLEEKVGQVFIFTIVNEVQAMQDLALHPGGYVRIYSDALTVARQNATLQAGSKTPLLLSADFERGIGSTVTGAVDLVTNMCIGATGDDQFAYRCGKAIAQEAIAMGINMNYVPVLDVNINEDNPIINIRAFGGKPELVARMGAAFIRGSQAGGVITCGKHFPGHGDTSVDSHTNLGSIEADRNRMERVELLPFRAAIAVGVDAMMSAHLLIPAFEPEPLPATLSRRIMHNLLREELGFDGVTVSDALEMGGIAKNFSPEEAIVRAVNAGIDQLIMPVHNARSTGILLDAVKDGRVSETRIDEAVARILTLKERRGVMDAAPIDLSNLAGRLNTPEHQQDALEAALAGITLITNKGGALPLQQNRRVAVISFSNFEDSRSYYLEPKTFASHLRAQGLRVSDVNCAMLDERAVHEFQVMDRAVQAARESDVVVLGAFVRVVINRGCVGLERRYVDFVERICALGKPVVLVSFGNPYLVKQFREVQAYVCGYGSTEATQHAMALLLAGKRPFLGNLPVALSLE